MCRSMWVTSSTRSHPNLSLAFTQAGGNYYGGGGFSVSNSGGYSPYLEIATPGFGVFSTYGAHF